MKRKGTIIIYIIFLLLLLLLFIGLWLSSGNNVGQVISKIIYSVLLMIFMVWTIFQCYIYNVSKIEFEEDAIRVNERNSKTTISYNQIQHVQYVVRRMVDSKNEPGKLVTDIQHFGGYMPYYDIITKQNELFGTIDLELYDEKIIEQYFLQKGIKVYSKEGCLNPIKKRMTGKMINNLRMHEMHDVEAVEVKKYIEHYNQVVSADNDRKKSYGRYLYCLGMYLGLVFVPTKHVSFLFIATVCILFGVVWNLKKKEKEVLKIQDEYMEGCAFWGKADTEFVVFFENNEMKRRDDFSCFCINGSILNDVNYCVINKNMKVVMIGEIDDLEDTKFK